jgi:hypothetical protein
MFKEPSDEEVKAIILGKLRNRGCWGARYMPFNTLVRWLSRKIKRNGKRVQRASLVRRWDSNPRTPAGQD